MELQALGHRIELDETRIKEGEEAIRHQLEDYLDGETREFELEVELPEGFTGEVMKQVLRIPRGETRSYGEIAQELGSSPIAVGQACARNPLPVVVPCHRVVGKNSIGGYQYPGLKQKLLDLETSTPGNR